MAAGGNTIGSVYVRVRPRVRNFRRQTEDELRRELTKPIEVDVKTKLNEEGLKDTERELDKQLKPIQRKATIKFDADYDGIGRAMDRLNRQLKDMERQEIEFTANADGLNKALDDLERRKDDSVARVEFSADESSYNSILQKIEDIRRQKRTIEIDFKTDEASLRAMENTARAKLDEMKRWEPIEFRYTDDVEGNRALVQRIEQLRRERVEIPVNLNVDDSTLDDILARATARSRDLSITPTVNPAAVMWAEGTLAALARDRWVELKPRINRRVMRDLQGAFLAIAGVNTIGKLIEQIEHVALNFDEVSVAASSAGAAIGSIVSLGTVGLGSLLSIAGDTLQVFQGIAMAPTLMLTGASVLQTWKAIWNDFGAALMGIPGVLEKMPPNAQRAVKAVEALNDAVNGAVQDNFWGEMTDEVARFTENLGPHVVTAMGQVASVMGSSVSTMINHAERLANSGQLEKFTRNNTKFMERFGTAAELAFEALMNMGIKGSEYLPSLGRYIEDLSRDFKGFMDEAVRTGKFDQWIDNSIRSIQSLGQFAKGTWDTLVGITKAFESVGGKGLHEMADGMERVADFVNSSGFQSKMQGIFRAAMDGSVAVGKGFGDLMTQLYSMDQFLGTLLRKSGELAGSFISQVARALDSVPLQDGLVDMFDGMLDFVNKAGPGFGSIADIFGRLASIGGEVAREIAHGMNLTMGAIEGFIARIQGPLINAIHPLTKVFEDIAALGTPVLNGLAHTMGGVLSIFAALPGPIQNVITLLTILGRTGFLAGFLKTIQGIGNYFTTMRVKAAREFVMMERAASGSAGRMAKVIAGYMGGVATQVQARMNVIGQSLRRVFGMQGLLGVLGGPWGIALTAAVGGLAAFAGASAEAKAKQDELKATLDQVTGAMTEQTGATLFDQMTAEVNKTEGFWRSLGHTVNNELKAWVTGGENANRAIADIGDTYSEMAQSLGMDSGRIVDAMAQGGEAAQKFAGDLNHLYTLSGKGWGTEELQAEAERIGYMGDVSQITAEKMAASGPLVKYLMDTYSGLTSESERLANKSEHLGTAVATSGELMANLPDKVSAIADAIGTFNDVASTAEQKAEAFRRALDLLAGGEETGRAIERSAKSAYDQAIANLDALAEAEGFNWAEYFDPKSGQLDFDTGIGREISVELENLNHALQDEIAGIKQQLTEGAITPGEANKLFEEVIKKSKDVPRQVGEALGLTEDQIKELTRVWNSEVFDEKDARIVFSSIGSDEIDQTVDRILATGREISAEEFVAKFDANDDGAITKLEQVNGLGIIFSESIFEARLSGDATEMQNAVAEAANAGVIWDGEKFIATLDADDEPTNAAIEAAKAFGLEWDGQRFAASVDAEEDPMLRNNILMATEALNEFARDYKATFSAEGAGPVMEEITGLEEAAARYESGAYIGHFLATGTTEAVEQAATVTNSAVAYRGNYDGHFQATGTDTVVSNANKAKSAADGVEGPRTAALGESGSGTVTSRSNTASTAADKVDGGRIARLMEFGGGVVQRVSGLASTAADKVKGARMAILNVTDNATTIIQGAVNALKGFVSRTITLTASFLGIGDNADGSLTDSHRFAPKVRKFANGGFENHVAQIAKPSPVYRVWAEPETGGEAYIPLASSKRTRSLAIWQEVGRRFGVFNNGGVVGGETGNGRTTNINVVNHYPKSEPTSRTVNDGLEYAAALGLT